MWVEAHNGAWRIRDRRAGKVVTIKSGYPTKTAAKAARDAYSTDKLRGEFIDPRAGDMWMRDWITQWWSAHQNTLKISSRRPEDSRVRNQLLPRLGGLRLGEFDNATDAWWVSEMQADGLSPKTIRNCHGLLFQAMEAAIRAKRIKQNPCKGTKMPDSIPHEMAFLNEHEAAALVAAHPEEWRAVPLLMLGTGLRWAELSGLRVGRVDVLGGTLRVEETLQEITGKGLVSVPPKTKWSRRTITLPLEVCDVLVPLVANRKRNELVFTHEKHGGPIRHQDFTRRIWSPARDAADLSHVRIHDLRHTHAAWLIADQIPLTAIQRRLGHSSVAITSDIYGHLLPEVDERLLASLQRRLTPGEHQGSNLPGEPRKSSENIGDNQSSGVVPIPGQ